VLRGQARRWPLRLSRSPSRGVRESKLYSSNRLDADGNTKDADLDSSESSLRQSLSPSNPPGSPWGHTLIAASDEVQVSLHRHRLNASWSPREPCRGRQGACSSTRRRTCSWRLAVRPISAQLLPRRRAAALPRPGRGFSTRRSSSTCRTPASSTSGKARPPRRGMTGPCFLPA